MASRNTPPNQDLDDFLRFTGNIRSTNPNTVFILVLGMTGSGKSTLIQHCTGKDVLASDSLRSCTNDLSVHSFFHALHHVHLIDTPGFDDTNRSDIDTLRTISNYLGISFTNGVRVGGIIYLHRISDNRMSGTGLRNLRMLKKLSGTSAWSNIVIGTTMWKAAEYNECERRERELMENKDYFGDMLSEGTNLFRIAEHGTGAGEQKHSALQMISHLIRRIRSFPMIELDIQRELVLQGKALGATTAGKTALGDIYHLQQQLARQLQRAQQDIQENMKVHNTQYAQQLQSITEDCEQKLKESESEQEKLKASLMDMHDEEVEKLQKILEDMEWKQHLVLENKRQELEDMENSLKRMCEQSATDAARWEEQRLDIATLQNKKHASDMLNRECEQHIDAIKSEVAKEETRLQSICQAKSAVRHNVMNGIANGATTGLTTAFATAVLAGALCVVA